MKNEQNEYITDVTQTSVAQTITWTTNEPTSSTAATIADGDAVTSTETGQLIQNFATQIEALIVDMAAVIAKVNS